LANPLQLPVVVSRRLSALLFGLGQLHACAEAKTKLATAPATFAICPSLSAADALSLSWSSHLKLGFGGLQIGLPQLVSLLTSRTPVAASAAEFSTPFSRLENANYERTKVLSPTEE